MYTETLSYPDQAATADLPGDIALGGKVMSASLSLVVAVAKTGQTCRICRPRRLADGVDDARLAVR